ncbi:hypothetical protein C0966_12330 [Bacillus methanolicus]|nr:hypothetical protein [Bacillus methanolicus]
MKQKEAASFAKQLLFLTMIRRVKERKSNIHPLLQILALKFLYKTRELICFIDKAPICRFRNFK